MGNSLERAAPADLYAIQRQLQERVVPINYTFEQVKPVSRRAADLQWRINFANMKLSNWADVQNDKWQKLKIWHERALIELNQLIAA